VNFANAFLAIVATAFASSAIACAWVDPEPGSEGIRLISRAEATRCTKIGSARANTKHSVGFISRSERTIDEELLTLGRNEAAKLGGNALVAIGEPDQGRLAFDVYRCG
jgi:hypothetical protein